MNSNIARFISEFESTPFNHQQKLISGLRSGEVSLHSAPKEKLLSISHFLAVYEFRLQHLEKRFGSKHTSHTKSLRYDTADLCSGLRGHQTDRCELWSFTEAPYFKYGVFVGHESRIILGCIRGVDDRLITPETRIELWGEITPDSGE